MPSEAIASHVPKVNLGRRALVEKWGLPETAEALLKRGTCFASMWFPCACLLICRLQVGQLTVADAIVMLSLTTVCHIMHPMIRTRFITISVFFFYFSNMFFLFCLFENVFFSSAFFFSSSPYFPSLSPFYKFFFCVCCCQSPIP